MSSLLTIMDQPKQILLLCLCISCALVWSCGKSGAPVTDLPSDGTPGHISGMGPSTGELSGSPFQMPADITVNGAVQGRSALESGAGYCQIAGSGIFVLLSMELINHSGKDTLLSFPAGLCFTAKNKTDQNGLLIQALSLPLARGASCKVLLYAYCLNEHRHASSDNSAYGFGPVSEAPPLKELIALLATKKLNLAPGETPRLDGPEADVQLWLWKITDGNGLTVSDKQKIDELKDR